MRPPCAVPNMSHILCCLRILAHCWFSFFFCELWQLLHALLDDFLLLYYSLGTGIQLCLHCHYDMNDLYIYNAYFVSVSYCGRANKCAHACVCKCVYLSVCLSIRLSVHLPIRPSVCLSVSESVLALVCSMGID